MSARQYNATLYDSERAPGQPGHHAAGAIDHDVDNAMADDEDIDDEEGVLEDDGDDEEGDEEEGEEEEDDDVAAKEPGSVDVNEAYIATLRKMEAQGLVDIGNLALWKLSSHKAGCGLQQLREDNPETFWQSDGVQPHYINIHFNKKVQIRQLSIFTNYYLDESYTPSRIVVMAGNGSHNLKEVTAIEVQEPTGWTSIHFRDARHDGILKTFFLRVVIEANHQNGKDTHIRALKIFSPVSSVSYDIVENSAQESANENAATSNNNDNSENKNNNIVSLPFTSVKFRSQSTIR